MQGAIARVCMVMAAAILNHPLLFPQENGTLPEQDEELMARMREHEERMEREQARLEKELSLLDSRQKEEEDDEEGGSENCYSWYLWSAVSFVIFVTIEMGRSDAAEQEEDFDDLASECGSVGPREVELDKDVLSDFCDRCGHTLSHDSWKVRAFAEGFVDDLLESLRSVCDRDADMEVGDFVGVGSMFESWKASKPLTCDIIVPFSPPEPYAFQFQLWCDAASGVPPDMQGCGRIKVSKQGWEDRECLCGSANLGEDMLCLLHRGRDTPNVDYSPDELLCSKNTPFLSKDQVMRWFQISVTKAWGLISHKYEFEVTFRNLDAAGALKVRFRSGKVISLNIIPVVRLQDTEAYFVSHFPSACDDRSDPYWALSCAVYERHLLRLLAKHLPHNSCHIQCLQVVTFLHGKQTGLSGKSALTNYHLKTALLHLLLSKKACAWTAESLERRLGDVLRFLQRSLREKRLYHVVIGNGRVPEELGVPKVLRGAEPVNLLRPLVLQRDLHGATVRHFNEMLKNAPALIQEYTPHLSNGGLHLNLDV